MIPDEADESQGRSSRRDEVKLILTISTPARHWACQVPCIFKILEYQGFERSIKSQSLDLSRE